MTDVSSTVDHESALEEDLVTHLEGVSLTRDVVNEEELKAHSKSLADPSTFPEGSCFFWVISSSGEDLRIIFAPVCARISSTGSNNSNGSCVRTVYRMGDGTIRTHTLCTSDDLRKHSHSGTTLRAEKHWIYLQDNAQTREMLGIDPGMRLQACVASGSRSQSADVVLGASYSPWKSFSRPTTSQTRQGVGSMGGFERRIAAREARRRQASPYYRRRADAMNDDVDN
eukprot:Rmarinus@m.11014